MFEINLCNATEGFSVSLFYCFLNSEVRLALRHRLERWRDERNIRLGQIRQRSRRPTGSDYGFPASINGTALDRDDEDGTCQEVCPMSVRTRFTNSGLSKECSPRSRTESFR
ncbi:diuretic hormone receptor [Culex quinquefasciatus]|uniref:Diuretic hormone receptor n=1 Tax=Culex quinquefasciatus TaxID=7176 RepID=B0WPS3_CULQU|nr:diuretic hormone receptor [Culex quinquefasciatus]|eukprot:XP_001850707.1 diuretic hormone receptor [Culex quinquefasciatus]